LSGTAPTRADLFVAGFSCKPFSTLRPRRFEKNSVEDHVESHLFPDIVQHIRMNEPRLFFLENVVGWALTSRLDGGDSWMARHMAMLDDLGKYETTFLKLDLLRWADARRERFYVVGCHRDMCPTAQALAEFERLVDDARGRAAPEDITKHIVRIGHPLYAEKLRRQRNRLGIARRRNGAGHLWGQRVEFLKPGILREDSLVSLRRLPLSL